MLPQSLVTVRPPVLAWPGDPDGADRWRGGPATDGAAPASQTVAGMPSAAVPSVTVPSMAGPSVTGPSVTGPSVPGPPALAHGGCCVWPLPADATCAAVARDVFA